MAGEQRDSVPPDSDADGVGNSSPGAVNDQTLSAKPTKQLFIEILTKDIPLISTVPEFIDSSFHSNFPLQTEPQ